MFIHQTSLYLPGWQAGQDLDHWKPPTGLDGGPSLDFLAAKQRRRLSLVARLALDLAHRLAPSEVLQEALLVFAGEHGEISTTLKLLGQWIQGEPLSPAGFSHSVHNAPLGRLSLIHHNHQPASAVSMGADSLQAGLFEAASLLYRYPDKKVVLILADEPVGPPLDGLGLAPPWPYGLGLLLSAQAGSTLVPLPGQGPLERPAALEFYAQWQQQAQTIKLPGERLGLKWNRAN